MLVEFGGPCAAQLKQMYPKGPFEACKLGENSFLVEVPGGGKRFKSGDVRKVLPEPKPPPK